MSLCIIDAVPFKARYCHTSCLTHMDHLQVSSRFHLNHVNRGPSDTSQSLLRGEAKRREIFLDGEENKRRQVTTATPDTRQKSKLRAGIHVKIFNITLKLTDVLCRYFWKPAGCWKGEFCPFLHEQTPLPPPSGSNVLAPHDSGLQAAKLPPLTGLEASAPDDPELQALKPGEPVKGSPAWKEHVSKIPCRYVYYFS